jgi:hypothetical protein
LTSPPLWERIVGEREGEMKYSYSKLYLKTISTPEDRDTKIEIKLIGSSNELLIIGYYFKKDLVLAYKHSQGSPTLIVDPDYLDNNLDRLGEVEIKIKEKIVNQYPNFSTFCEKIGYK